MTIFHLQKQAYEISKSKGWHDNDGDYNKFPERIALTHSELSEALEADRKGKTAELPLFYKAMEAGNSMPDAFERFVKDTVEDELADAMIRLLDMAESMGIDLERHVILKMDYNKTRPHKHGGKAY